ncbi:muconolactone delta-isomerase [Paraburkholderia atlantica]|uniref:muconolactone Delta-isomerase family protein n=1 Tax=Paraburkholderia atlantica TaxID=2654982 RepID=UPI003D1D4A78
MQYLVLTSLDAAAPSDVVLAGLESEHQQVRELHGASVLRQIWRREDRRGAVLLFEVTSETEVSSYPEKLPLTLAGAVKVYLLVPLGPHAALVGNAN